MKVKISVEEFEDIMKNLNEEYKMIAPVSILYAGT